MILKIRTYPDRVLRQNGKVVEKIDDRIRQLAADMLETMPAADGLGLAAQQVGEALRLFTMVSPEDPDQGIVIINPEIEQVGAEKMYIEEGCLSVPGKQCPVRRAKHIRLSYMDLAGEQQTIELAETLARAAQHEFDHINGILFIDRIAPQRRRELLEEE